MTQPFTALCKRVAQLVQRRELTPTDAHVWATLIWRCRAPGSALCRVSQRQVAKLAGVCRNTVGQALLRFRQAGLLVRRENRVRVQWLGAAFASRRATDTLVFQVRHTVPTPVAAYSGVVKKEGPTRASQGLELALARLGAVLSG